MNLFGGNWTERKIEIVVEYAKAYLTIMNKYPRFKCLYFDGFAGSGNIYKNNKTDIEAIKGAAIRILEIESPKNFDLYYFVEIDEKNKRELDLAISDKFPHKRINSFVVQEDCNVKINSMAAFLQKHKDFRVLAFIDPFGMTLNWSSLEVLKGLGIDLWILVPTGIGMNRLLKRTGEISQAWLRKLELTFGVNQTGVKEYFYKSKTVQTLFGSETMLQKEKDAIEKAGALYRKRLNTVFKFVSEMLALKNSTGSTMYHLMMASNNKVAFRIANDIIEKYKSI